MTAGRKLLEPQKKITVDLPFKISPEVYEALKIVSSEHGMAAAQYVRSLLYIHLNKLRMNDSKSEAKA